MTKHDELIDEEIDILWTSKPGNISTAIKLGFKILYEIIYAIGLLAFIYLFGGPIFKLIMLVLFTFLVAYRIYKFTWVAILAKTMHYGISTSGIHFKWGYINKNNASIPHEDIVRISLITYKKKKHATIYFDTKGNHKIQGLNFKKAIERHSPTFENVENGADVKALLEKLRKNRNEK